MGREENAAIFRDTEARCRTHPRLKASIAFSRASQRLIRESDNVSVPPCGNTAEGRLIVSPKRTFEAASAYARTMKACVLNFASAGNPGGAFRNDPNVVSAAAAAVIPHYRTRFKVIEFAVFCRPGDMRNYDAFKRAFG